MKIFSFSNLASVSEGLGRRTFELKLLFYEDNGLGVVKLLSFSSIPPSKSKKLLKIEANLFYTSIGTGSFLGLVDLLAFFILLLVGSSSMMMSMFGTNFLFVFVSGYFILIPEHYSDLLRARPGKIFGD